ncbi:hypothetical protein [Corticicoccus populi]|uniref:Uncharacterized protein n=1 Tax=Corticicoccus populi TaxID=1812821 RepID=A0ABW5WRS3_9STAP
MNLIIESLEALIQDGLTKEEFHTLVENFKCDFNEDVEYFLLEKAYSSCVASQSRTFLVRDEEKLNEILGYFTLSHKTISFNSEVSANERKKLTGSKQSDGLSGILIAQLGKNTNASVNIKGMLLLNEAENLCNQIFETIALRVVILEHDDVEELHRFYGENHYKILDKASDKNNHLFLRYKRLDRNLN